MGRARAALAGFALGLLLSACPGRAPCDAAHCGGCCDAEGVCRAGGQALTCGSGGAACVRCAQGEQCVSRACVALPPLPPGPPDGGDGGRAPDAGVPEDAGTDAGQDDAGCRSLGTLALLEADGGYRGTGDQAPPNDFTWALAALDGGGAQWLRLELWHEQAVGAPVSPPLTRALAPPVRYAGCDVCLLLQSDCDGAQCAVTFLAQQGTLSVSQGTRSADAGTLEARGQALRLWAWDLVNDRPAEPAACLGVDDLTVRASWP